ncbi:hypothetical protein Neosp_003425 [[Neocosmospora] mangrovei]
MPEVNILFEYPSVGRDVVSESAPGVKGPTYGPDPEVHPYEDDSGSDSEDYESEEEEKEDPYPDWNPRAINFLAKKPPSDEDWSSHLPRNGTVNSLFHRLRIPFLFPGLRGSIDWVKFFAECKWHLARACNEPALASLFTLVFIAAIHVSQVDGLPREYALNAMRECVRQCGIWEYELTEPMLKRLQSGATKGIWLLNEYTRTVGVRAHEMPLFTYIKGRIPFTYRPTTPVHIECLEIPSMMYSMLGESKSKWDYQEIREILQPEGIPLPLYKDICMADVKEFDEDESDEEDMDDCDGLVCDFEYQYASSEAVFVIWVK